MMPRPSHKARAILDRICYATLATADLSGNPWNSPVYCAYDENYNIYWGSDIQSQHSQNIYANGKVFIVIYDSTVAAGLGEGVYIQAKAAELNDRQEIAEAHKIIQDRRRPVPYWQTEEVQLDRPVHLFKAIPEHIWMNDDGEKDGQYVDIRVKEEA